MIDILKSPAEGSGGFVVLLDVADQLSGEISCRSEDPASDDIALDFGKPDLDLIEPTGIGRGVMDPYGWMGLEELENILGFMCAQVVGHDMNLSTLRLAGLCFFTAKPLRVYMTKCSRFAGARASSLRTWSMRLASRPPCCFLWSRASASHSSPAVYVAWSVQVDLWYFAGCSPLPRPSSYE